ncbi:hypothetical protein R1sor_012162 [Riccia sorocarpa]|uniref:Uncharacterized protein n=1 Tax=Riccia sorocarpa TaxID=122646 RepID=A0ABD3I488_9MARC
MANKVNLKSSHDELVITKSNVRIFVTDDELVKSFVPTIKLRGGEVISYRQHMRNERLKIMVDCTDTAMLNAVNGAYAEWEPDNYKRTGPLSRGSKLDFTKTFAKLLWAKAHLLNETELTLGGLDVPVDADVKPRVKLHDYWRAPNAAHYSDRPVGRKRSRLHTESDELSTEEEPTWVQRGGPVFGRAYGAFQSAKKAFKEVEEGLKGTDMWLLKEADGGDTRIQLLKENYKLRCDTENLQEKIRLMENSERDYQGKIRMMEDSESQRREEIKRMGVAHSCEVESLQRNITGLKSAQTILEESFNMRIAQLEDSERQTQGLNKILLVEIIGLNKEKEKFTKITEVFFGQSKQALDKVTEVENYVEEQERRNGLLVKDLRKEINELKISLNLDMCGVP